MKNLTKIAVILNPNDDRNLEVDRAVRLAKENHAKIDLIAFMHHKEYRIIERIRAEANVKISIENNTLDKINKQIEPLKDKGIDISARVEWCDHIAVAVFDLMVKEKYDLLIKSPHSRSLLKNIFSTPTDWAIIRSSPCPVWLCTTKSNEEGAIIAAVDVQVDNPKVNAIAVNVVHHANYLAHLLGRQLHVINTFPPMPAAAHLQFVSIYENEYLQEMSDSHRAILNELVEPFDIPENHRHIISGDTDLVLNEYIKKHAASLLVMGSSTRDGLSGLMTGNIAEQIINHIECDLLVIRTQDLSQSKH